MAAATLVSASAFASVGLSVRSDYINHAKNDDAGIEGSSIFFPSYARLTAGGKVGEAEVVANFDITKTSSATGEFVNHLYIKKSFADGWSMSIGKLVNPTGGFEAEVIDAGNDYNASIANGGAIVGTFAGTETVRLDNSSGVAATWTSGAHSVELQATNDSDHAAGATADRAHNYGLAYTGGLSESLWLKVSYFNGFLDVTDVDQNFTGVGIRWASAPFDITFDYLMNSSKDVAADTTDKTTSMVANIRYTMDNMTPFLKVEMSEVKPDGADADKKTGLTAGLEVSQSPEFRYHVAYATNTFDYAAAGDNVTDSSLIAGIKWNVDLLK